MKIEIKNRWSGELQFTADIETDSTSHFVQLGLAVKLAIKRGASLCGAELAGANLRGADLRGADLAGADLYGASLRGADLRLANLAAANLRGADLYCANLRGADLTNANLRGADLCGAELHVADLRLANLSGADLRGADLCGADLRGADLPEDEAGKLALAQTRILPDDGDVIGWKKCKDGVLVKLLVPACARRSHAFGRKCRAEFVTVLEVIGAAVGYSQYDDGQTSYSAGETVHCGYWETDWREECAGGIHFFITRPEAEDYYS